MGVCSVCESVRDRQGNMCAYVVLGADCGE